MESISEALAKGRRGWIAMLSARSGCSLAKSQPRAGWSTGGSGSQTYELSKRLRKHTRSELCIEVSQDDICVAPDFGSMNEVMIDQD